MLVRLVLPLMSNVRSSVWFKIFNAVIAVFPPHRSVSKAVLAVSIKESSWLLDTSKYLSAVHGVSVKLGSWLPEQSSESSAVQLVSVRKERLLSLQSRDSRFVHPIAFSAMSARWEALSDVKLGL